MKTNYLKRVSLFTVAAVAGVISCAAIAQAEPSKKVLTSRLESQCSELVKECFSYNSKERSQCFYSASHHPFCVGSALGKLTYKRWTMSPGEGLNDSQLEEAPAFLGPQIVNQNCLGNFDSQWSGMLLKGDLSVDAIRALERTLETCQKQNEVEIPRP